MSARYRHWFWHNPAINWASNALARLSAWLWRQRYGRHYVNDFWQAVGPKKRKK